MVYTITLNPSLDYTVRVKNFELGKVNRTEAEVMTPGGKGINVTRVLTALGTKSVALGFIGGFTGAEIQSALNLLGVKTDFIECGGVSRVNVKIKSGEETEINGRGAIVENQHVDALIDKLKAVESGDAVVLSGSVPASLKNDVYVRILQAIEGKDALTVVDATGETLLKTLKYRPFLIKPNADELSEIFGVEIKSLGDVQNYSHKLREMGARNIIISLGGMGAYMLCESGDEYFTAPPSGEKIDTVGAGDSLVAGFVSEYLLSGERERALLRGVATGSATAFSEGLATKEKSDALFDAILQKGSVKI